MTALPTPASRPTFAPDAFEQPVPSLYEPDDYEFADFAPDKAAVASLSPLDIARMTRSELVAAVVAADLPVLGLDSESRLRFMDRWTLERLAYLARHCCRNQGY